MSKRAHDVIESVNTIVGYTTYVDLIRHLVQDKNIVTTAMKKEVDRVQAAIDIALGGESCVVVCSGDPGIYAMSGLIFEICQKNEIPVVQPGEPLPENRDKKPLRIEVVPGIPALSSGASLLGAPLTHDFATISLSDLLTPWELIEKRIAAAAMADFVIVFYNPKSKKRDWQLNRAQEIILEHRKGDTVVGIATSAMREEQRVSLTTLDKLHEADVNMQTTVFVGNSSTLSYDDFMITPRGYSKKYAI